MRQSCDGSESFVNGLLLADGIGFSHRSQDGRGEFWKTVDGGCHWNFVTDVDPANGDRFGDIVFSSSLEGWLVGIFTTNLFHTKDAGESWSAVPLVMDSQEAHGWGVYFTDSNVGWVIVDDSCCVLKTINAGKTWTKISLPEFAREDIPPRWYEGKVLQWLQAAPKL